MSLNQDQIVFFKYVLIQPEVMALIQKRSIMKAIFLDYHNIFLQA